MSDCGVCVGGWDGEPATFLETRIVKRARKQHVCSECGDFIPVGGSYQTASGMNDGDFWTYKTCLVCTEIRAAFSCNGITYGGIFWEDFNDGDCWSALNVSCFDRLTTPEAKAELQRRWMEWKGLTK